MAGVRQAVRSVEARVAAVLGSPSDQGWLPTLMHQIPPLYPVLSEMSWPTLHTFSTPGQPSSANFPLIPNVTTHTYCRVFLSCYKSLTPPF